MNLDRFCTFEYLSNFDFPNSLCVFGQFLDKYVNLDKYSFLDSFWSNIQKKTVLGNTLKGLELFLYGLFEIRQFCKIFKIRQNIKKFYKLTEILSNLIRLV